MWLAVTAAVGAVCLVLCRAGRMKKRTALLAVLVRIKELFRMKTNFP